MVGKDHAHVIQIDPYILEKVGFGELRNVLTMHARCDWVQHLDADEMLDAAQRPLVREMLAEVRQNVVGVTTKTYLPETQSEFEMNTPWEEIIRHRQCQSTGHRRFFRRLSTVAWRGYIHEELYEDGVNAFGRHIDLGLVHHHFTNFRGWVDPFEKRRKYAWMIRNASRNPRLQRFTNPWWYQTYWPANKAELEKLADEYEMYNPELKV